MNNLKTNLLMIALILGMLGIGYGWYDSNQKKNNALDMHVKLEKALSDTARTFENERGEWVSAKRTLQFDLKEQKNINGSLSEKQKDLMNRIRKSDKNNEVMSAALFTANATIAGLLNEKGEVLNDSTIGFSDFTDTLQYKLIIGNARAYKTYKPFLLIDSLNIPTDYFVEFNWDKSKRENYPMSFNVTPTNPMINITSVESYAIPEAQKIIVNPTGWNKVGNFFKNRWQDLLFGGVGFGLGLGVGAK